jgi:ferredoxin like protein
VRIDAKLAHNAFKLDTEPHIVVDQSVCATACTNRACLTVCPADLYELDAERIIVNWEGCLECGTCMMCCDQQALSWEYPRSEFGIRYRLS